MTEKACRKCGRTKQLEEFHEHPQMADGHLHACKECQNAYTRSRHRDPDKERDRLAAWRAAHPEKWKAARQRAQAKAMQNGTGASSAAARREREASAKSATISIKGVIADHGMVCSICLQPIEHESQLAIDHTIPLARGGSHSNENLRPAHRSCNAWKRDRLPSEIAGLIPPGPGEVDVAWEEKRRTLASAARSEATRARMAAMTPEERAARAAKISAATKGKKKRQFGTPEEIAARKAKQAAGVTPGSIVARSAAVKAAWANKTPEEREAWRAKCRAVKAGSKGNIDNLRKGWAPEVRAKAIAASADLRRGTEHTEEHKAAIAEGVKAAYAEGRRVAGHTEETKRKISETKRAKCPPKNSLP